jgi:hypothetical protein
LAPDDAAAAPDTPREGGNCGAIRNLALAKQQMDVHGEVLWSSPNHSVPSRGKQLL